MSIQERINHNVSEDGREFYSFVIKGETGDADVPENVSVNFYDCQIGTLTLNGRNLVFIEGGSVSSVTAKTSRLMSRDTSYDGDVALEGCTADLFGGSTTGKWALTDRSHLRTDNFAFSAADIGVSLKEGSQARFTRTTFDGHATAAVQADEASFASLSKCDSVKATKVALWAQEKSVIEAVECQLIQGTGQWAVKAEKSGRVELLDCQTLKGNTDALTAEDKGFISAAKSTTIVGDGGSALLLKSEAAAEIRSCQDVIGKGKTALILEDTNRLYLADVQTIKSQAADALEAKNGSVAELVSVDSMVGQGGNAITASAESRVTLLRVTKAGGRGGDGAKIEGESRLTLGDMEELVGQSGNGVTLSGKSHLDVHTVAKIEGVSGDGINASQECVAILNGIEKITGSAGHGVSLSQKCKAILLSITEIVGSSGDGVTGSNECSIRMSNCEKVTGSSGAGVKLVNGKALHITGSTTITGSSSHGIQAEDAVVRLQNIEKITGQGAGVKLTNCDFRSDRVAIIEGQGAGFAAVGRGASEDVVDIRGATNINGNDVGLSIESVRAFTKGCSVNGTTALKFSGAQHESRIDQFNGDADLEDGVLSFFESTITGKFMASDTVLLDLRGKLGSESQLDSVAALLAGSNLPSGDASGSGIVGAKATVGSIDMDDAGFGLFGGGGADGLDGSGSVLSARAGIPPDGVDFVVIVDDEVTSQNTSNTKLKLKNEDIELEAEGNYLAKVEGDYSVEAQGDIDFTCQGSGTWTANTSLTLEGQASITVTSDGVATVSGSLIMHE